MNRNEFKMILEIIFGMSATWFQDDFGDNCWSDFNMISRWFWYDVVVIKSIRVQMLWRFGSLSSNSSHRLYWARHSAIGGFRAARTLSSSSVFYMRRTGNSEGVHWPAVGAFTCAPPWETWKESWTWIGFGKMQSGRPLRLAFANAEWPGPVREGAYPGAYPA